MTERHGATESTDDATEPSTDRGLDRRTVLRGTALTGLAGAGLTGTASAETWNEITFCAAGDDTFEYRFEVDSRVERGGKFDSDGYDEVGDDFAEGAVAEERCDSFRFTGELVEIRLSGPGRVLINGDVVKDTTEELPNAVTVEADSDAGRVDYRFRVSGRVERGSEASEEDEITDSNVVRGTVFGGNADSFRYSGALAFDEASGPVTVTLDVNPD